MCFQALLIMFSNFSLWIFANKALSRFPVKGSLVGDQIQFPVKGSQVGDQIQFPVKGSLVGDQIQFPVKGSQ